ncbi:ubiquitin carboxyl-terminal hydrolase 15-like [Diaphorina citri]|jgi:Ubiquitin C-terminal hydrolase|uniref:Ubiquitin carboxyl-terminal hydrolase n=1 Tax=Diaphorina citri TaxID=121845 RepID=A0A1S3DNK9_DIACI|nr:ubiquitin carboxyl-terminal hydrolase 15-like [Diaphorina citri]KAI5712666.1 hypothetical protein M8J75_010305 [Diaphorina citri]KAI5749144.1 hypothetical protein M8J76_004944 [Diaphorina citri]KAI5753776.1 hypothetical protein M8J77_003279 [Diaphorina citri]
MVTNISKIVDTTPEVQKREFQDVSQANMQCGDTWYILESDWYHRFQQFIGLEDPDGMVCNPGPIDNSSLLDDHGDLKKGLLENDDFVFIPENTWKKLHSWYGIVKGQSPIARKVIPIGMFSQSFIVEAYPLELKIATVENQTRTISHKFSKSDSIKKIADFAREHFKISSDIKVQLLTEFKHDPLSESSTVADENLIDGQMILVQTKSDSTEWKLNGSDVDISEPSTSIVRSDINSCRYTPGLCGLSNLGNTCFMNSVLQCMSNCPPITKYFLEDQHLSELNTTNPLGMKGLVAKAFGELIKTMWSGDNNHTAPSNFKIQVSRFAPQFSGYQQHDAQELLTFLLDGLHEDLNRVKKKPYIELKDADGRPDEVVAKESWDNYLKRNNSVIVDYFHGLLKSHVTCPQCECVSTTFDPFCYLSLPLPPKKNSYIQIKYIPYDQNKREVIYKLCIARHSLIRDICVDFIALAKLHVNIDQLVVAKVVKSHIHSFFSMNDTLDDVTERDNLLYVYDLPVSHNSTDFNVIPVCTWEVSDGDSTFCKNELIDDPILVAFPLKELSYAEIFQIIIGQMSRHFNIPKNDSLEDENNLSLVSEYVSIYQVSVNLSTHEKLSPDTTYILNEKNKLLAIQIESSTKKEYHKEVTPLKQDATEQRYRLKHSLDECLDLFVTNEKLGSDDAWYCPRCKKFQQATKKFDLWSVPKVLIIHLKRFHYSRYRRDKIETLVEFPVHDLDISKIVINKSEQLKKYDLVGVCNHYGTLGGGHYTAYAKNDIDKNWYLFDDSSVRKATESEVVSSCAYVLMYIQQDD